MKCSESRPSSENEVSKPLSSSSDWCHDVYGAAAKALGTPSPRNHPTTLLTTKVILMGVSMSTIRAQSNPQRAPMRRRAFLAVALGFVLASIGLIASAQLTEGKNYLRLKAPVPVET